MWACGAGLYPVFIGWPCRSWLRTTGSATNWLYGKSDQIRSVAQSCPTLRDPMNHSTPSLPVHHQLPEFTETHVHRVSDAIQPSHPLSSSSPPAPNPSQHQGLFQWVNSSHEVPKYWRRFLNSWVRCSVPLSFVFFNQPFMTISFRVKFRKYAFLYWAHASSNLQK